jgi:hypothetical protein
MKSILLFLFLVFSKLNYAQDFSYLGPLNDDVILKLTTKELLLYAECVATIGMDGESFKWANNKTIANFKKNKSYYKGRVVVYDSQKNNFKVNPVVGKFKVPFEQSLFYIKRTKNNTIMKFYNFY